MTPAIASDRARAGAAYTAYGPGDIYSGLYYPIGVALLTFVIGALFVRETKDVDIMHS